MREQQHVSLFLDALLVLALDLVEVFEHTGHGPELLDEFLGAHHADAFDAGYVV